MLEICDRNRSKLAILHNAVNLVERIRLNGVSNFSFSLPITDTKNEYCQYFNFIRYKKGEYYRIIGEGREDHETGLVNYTAEHAIATLIDSCIPNFFQLGGLGMFTAEVIKKILAFQTTKHWVLKECDFARQFEYGIDKENLLASLFSVSNRFADRYQWIFNTKVYPFEVSLKRFDENKPVKVKIIKGHNRLTLTKQTDSKNLCTRLYAFGAGEGINQLDIASINGGKQYLQSSQEYIERFGLIEKIWIDRRYTVQESLLESAQVMLNELQEPYVEYETEVIEPIEIGEVVDIVGHMKTYVVETETYYNEVPKRYIKIANKPQDIAGSIADLADRQRIEMTYSQGATQVYAAQSADNADAQNPFTISLFIPNEMININSVFAKIKLENFRAYNTNLISGGVNKSSSAGGAQTKTSSSGGATTSSSGGATTTSSGGATTSSSGGGTNTSAGAGGASTTTSGSGGQTTSGSSSNTTSGTTAVTAGSVQIEDDRTNIGKHNHGLTTGNRVMQSTPTAWTAPSGGGTVTGGTFSAWTASGAHNHGSHSHDISHTHSLQTHTHSVTIQNHTHSITINNHTHTIGDHTHSIGSHTHSIGSHTHDITISEHTHTVDTSHTHNITPAITRFGNPTGFALLINGVVKANFDGRDAEINLTEYLVTADRKIPRGQWITIGVRPTGSDNGIAYTSVAYNIQGFCQSRGDMVV